MHQFIIEKSLRSDIEPRALEKIIMKFMELEKLGLTSSLGFKIMDNKGGESLLVSNLLEKPPNKIIGSLK